MDQTVSNGLQANFQAVLPYLGAQTYKVDCNFQHFELIKNAKNTSKRAALLNPVTAIFSSFADLGRMAWLTDSRSLFSLVPEVLSWGRPSSWWSMLWIIA
jgi:hypothetical protein